MTNVNRESPEYSITQAHFNKTYCWLRNKAVFETVQLFSDIGGAAGLMLGMSFATVIGIIDWLISFLTNLLMGRYRTVRRLTRKYSEVTLTINTQVMHRIFTHEFIKETKTTNSG